MWQQGKGGSYYVAVGYRRRLLCASRVQEEAAMWKQGTGYRRTLQYGSSVKGESAMWQQRKAGGCYVAARYGRRLLCGSTVKGEAAMCRRV